MRVGVCKLCKKAGQLDDSHLISKAIYKRLRSSKASNPNPVLISAGSAHQTSNQTKAHLLCRSCEQLLSSRGEKSIINLLSGEDRSSPIHDLLVEQNPSGRHGSAAVYAARGIPSIPIEPLAHFGLGVFWKASVDQWHAEKGELQINLGPYERRIREYLLNPDPSCFPKGVALNVIVLPPPKIPILIGIPVEAKKGEGFRNHRFYVPGIQFVLIVGKLAPIESCLIMNPQNPIWVADIEDQVNAIPQRVYLSRAPKARF